MLIPSLRAGGTNLSMACQQDTCQDGYQDGYEGDREPNTCVICECTQRWPPQCNWYPFFYALAVLCEVEEGGECCEGVSKL